MTNSHDYQPKSDASVRSSPTPLAYMPQLDALRAFAVLAVLAGHFTPTNSRVFTIVRLTELGGFGLRLFFVISGFLITGIILKSRRVSEENDQSPFYALRQFYVRRFLRIFPLFYFVLAAAAILNIVPVRETFLWHAAYLSNFYFFFYGWGGPTSHFWSLAVEEQFYIVFPWIILFAKRKWLPTILVFLIVFAPVFRLFCALYTGNRLLPVLPFSCLDTLCLGALMALRAERIDDRNASPYPFGNIGLLIGCAIYIAFVCLGFSESYRMAQLVIYDAGAALIAAWLVAGASIGFGGRFGKFLELKPLIYIGTISYGIYIYHYFVPYLLGRFFGLSAWLGQISQSAPMRFFESLIWCGATILLAALSWHLYERPINNLKRYFDYRQHRFTEKIVPVNNA